MGGGGGGDEVSSGDEYSRLFLVNFPGRGFGVTRDRLAACCKPARAVSVKPQCGVENLTRSICETKFEASDSDERIDQRCAIHDSDNISVATMDVRMTDQPAEALPLLEEDKLRQIARHVKDYIPGNGAGDIDEQKIKLISLFDEVLHTSSSITLTAGHRVAAWEALCTLIDQTSKSQHENVRATLWQANIWNRSLNLYLDQSPNARPKSSKSLLGSLSNVLRKCEGASWVKETKTELALQLVTAVSAREMQRDSKAYLLLFTHFLSKDIISLNLVLSQVPVAASAQQIVNNAETLLYWVFQWITRGDLGSILGQLIGVIMDNLDKTSPGSVVSSSNELPVPIWSGPLNETLGRDLENTEAYRSHIFPVLFKRSLPQYVAFLKQLGLDQLFTSAQNTTHDNSEEILYAALQTGKQLGLIEETTGEHIVYDATRVLVPVTFIGRLTLSANRSARLAGLSLFIASNLQTKPFQHTVLKQLEHVLPHLHADIDAFARSELFSLTQRMFERIRSAATVLARTPTESDKLADAQASIEHHKMFIGWYSRFIAWELRPTSSYQRHISALRCLSLLLRSGVDASVQKSESAKSVPGNAYWSFNVSIVDSGLHRSLLDLLMNSFEEVRQTAASILELCTSGNLASADEARKSLAVAKGRAITMMLSSGRADHADGVAYMYGLSYVLAETSGDRQLVLTGLLGKTEEMLNVADSDLARAVDKFPLHGLLTSLRYVLLRCDFSADPYPGLHERVSRILQHVWTVVKPTLCDDAPEGHVPEDMDDAPDISTKDILSYCWRALKEASMLMGAMFSPAMLAPCTSPTDFKKSMFELCFTQLGELRHRGAFSTVAQTWTTCCSLMENDDSTLGLQGWYERTISLLRRTLTINTRRSAGLPSLICGVLIADRSGALFKRAFNDIEQIARADVDLASAHESSLSQVHAMNCMKDILKNTRLSNKSEQYVLVALRLAADSLRSEAWGIRNCGLMLFRAVIDRLLGTNDAYVEDEVATKRRVDFEHHQDLLELVIGLLSTAPTSINSGESARNEGVFPALQLLQRAHMPESKRTEVQVAVFALTASPSWHVRDKAARTYASFVPVETTSTVLEQLLAGPRGDHNALHGALLCAMYIIRRFSTKILPPTAPAEELALQAAEEQRCNEIVAAAEWLRKDESCLYTSIAFVDVEVSLDALNKRISQSRDAANAQFQDAIENAVIALEGDHVKIPSSDVGRLSETEAMNRITNQTEADQWLEDRASRIEQEVAGADTSNSTFISNLNEWAQAVQTTLRDDSVFSRQAAVHGLSHLNDTWPKLAQDPSADRLLRTLCLSVYDLLNDDDEEIRIEAANSAYKILSVDLANAASGPTVPLVATQQLAELLTRRWPDNEDLFETAVARAFGVSKRGAKSVEQQLQSLEKAEYALFAEEKQNLYIDDVRETRIWAKVAMHVSASALQEDLLSDLTKWTVDGLAALIDNLKYSADGPLGWSSDETAFLLGLQVMHAAEVLLVLVGRGGGSPVDLALVLKDGLVGFVEAARALGGDSSWVREGERVLGGAGEGYSWESI
ncbi:hypothetical protein Q7P35_010530 [Cladosporium inversicolor]